MDKDPYGKDEAVSAQCDLYDIDDRLEEIKCNTY
jgi:hypothetical protein